MKLGTTIATALTALMRNKMRSLLTTLGVVIGVAAVIAMQAMGAGATAMVTGEISSLGSNMLVLFPGGESRQAFGGAMMSAPAFQASDLATIRRECTAVRHAAAQDGKTVVAVHGDANRRMMLYGATPELFEIREWGVQQGRVFTAEEQRRGAKVCVIGQTVREELFGSQDPIGAEIRVHDVGCAVIGVMAEKGVSTFGTDQDDVTFMPHSTLSRRITGSDRIGVILISAVSEDRIDEAKAQVESVMRERRHILEGEDDDFSVRDLREIQNILGSVTGVLTSLLAGVAAVSLLVGGIGIMNIMLVSVTERTREIGIRLAVGAQSHDILRQFLVEAVVLASVGGVIGVLIGVAGAYAGSTALEVPFSVPLTGTVLAFGFSVLVGVVFGVFPARKASKLRPIEALRYE